MTETVLFTLEGKDETLVCPASQFSIRFVGGSRSPLKAYAIFMATATYQNGDGYIVSTSQLREERVRFESVVSYPTMASKEDRK